MTINVPAVVREQLTQSMKAAGVLLACFACVWIRRGGGGGQVCVSLCARVYFITVACLLCCSNANQEQIDKGDCCFGSLGQSRNSCSYVRP